MKVNDEERSGPAWVEKVNDEERSGPAWVEAKDDTEEENERIPLQCR